MNYTDVYMVFCMKKKEEDSQRETIGESYSMWTCVCTTFASVVIAVVYVIGTKYLWSNTKHKYAREWRWKEEKKKKWTGQMMILYINNRK